MMQKTKSTTQRDDYRATLIVMFGLAIATLTGYLRQAAIAHQFGLGRGADIYLVAFALPEFVFTALPIILTPAFIPLFIECRQRIGERMAWKFAWQMAMALSAFLLLLILLAGWGAPLYLRWLSPGFGLEERALAVETVRWMLPALVPMGLATLAGAVLQVYRRFARPALLAAIYNLTFVVSMFVLPFSSALERAAVGVTLGTGAAFAFQVPVLWAFYRKSDSNNTRWGHVTGATKLPIRVSQVARLAGPLAAGYAIHHLILFVDRAMATTLEIGNVAALSYALHLAMVVSQLSGLAVSTVLFPRLTEYVSLGDLSAARDSLANALRLVWSIALPASVGLIILRTPIVQLLFERGAFTQVDTAAVSAPLVWYALAVMADALCQPFWRLVYAQQTTWTVLWVNSLQTVIRITGNLLLINLLGYVGLALSATLGLAVQALVLGWHSYRSLGSYGSSSWWSSMRHTVYATALMAIIVGLLATNLVDTPSMLKILACGTIGGLTYLAILQFPKYLRSIQHGV